MNVIAGIVIALGIVFFLCAALVLPVLDTVERSAGRRQVRGPTPVAGPRVSDDAPIRTDTARSEETPAP